MIKGGKGGSKTITGPKFEERVNLRTAFSKIPGYSVKDNNLLYKGRIVAQMYKKHEFYNKFLKIHKVDWSSIVSKKLIPDESIFILANNTLFIIEMKFQFVSGSVDEKLQTCDFKKKQYQKLLAKIGIKVKYAYILNDWFKKKEYKDTLDYIKSVDCHYFFTTLPLGFLGLPK